MEPANLLRLHEAMVMSRAIEHFCVASSADVALAAAEIGAEEQRARPGQVLAVIDTAEQ